MTSSKDSYRASGLVLVDARVRSSTVALYCWKQARVRQSCGGNIGALLPLWLEVGLNCMFPMEIRAGNDPVQLREEYGRDLLMMGGFDKFALMDSKEAILAELRRLEPVLRDCGFIPLVDHVCPDGVQFELYQYYIKEKCHFLGMPEHEIRQIPGLAGM